MIGGTLEIDAITRMISERCERLVILLSQAFFNSHVNEFFTSIAQALGIEQRKRKLIPCMYESLEPNVIPSALRFYHIIRRQRLGEEFWEKLRAAIYEPTIHVINESVESALPKYSFHSDN